MKNFEQARQYLSLKLNEVVDFLSKPGRVFTFEGVQGIGKTTFAATVVKKLLLNKKELRKIQKSISEKGLTIVPIRIFINQKGLAKLEIAIARGKKQYDKRATIKDRDAKRNLQKKDYQ